MLTDDQITAQFSANSTKVLEERYLKKDLQGNIIESIPAWVENSVYNAYVNVLEFEPREAYNDVKINFYECLIKKIELRLQDLKGE